MENMIGTYSYINSLIEIAVHCSIILQYLQLNLSNLEHIVRLFSAIIYSAPCDSMNNQLLPKSNVHKLKKRSEVPRNKYCTIVLNIDYLTTKFSVNLRRPIESYTTAL
jgi:hypothetical protein